MTEGQLGVKHLDMIKMPVSRYLYSLTFPNVAGFALSLR